MKLIAGNTLANGSQNADKDGKPIFSANNIDLDDPLGKKNRCVQRESKISTFLILMRFANMLLTFDLVQFFSLTKKPAPKKRV